MTYVSSGVRANDMIMDLVPNVETFRQAQDRYLNDSRLENETKRYLNNSLALPPKNDTRSLSK